VKWNATEVGVEAIGMLAVEGEDRQITGKRGRFRNGPEQDHAVDAIAVVLTQRYKPARIVIVDIEHNQISVPL
jgi:hypothetical protein